MKYAIGFDEGECSLRLIKKESDINELDINNDFDKENRKNNVSKNNEKKII